MPTLKDIVETIYTEAQSPDSIFRNKERWVMYRYAKQALDKFNLTFGQNLKGMNVHIPFSCKVSKPEDFKVFVRASLINCDGKTIEIKRNNNIPEKIYHYLLDCDGSLLKGDDGKVQKDECFVCNSSGSSSDETNCNPNCDACGGTGYLNIGVAQILKDLETHKNSWVKENPTHFEFSADLEGKAMIIEYIGSQLGSMTECQINVDDKYAEAMEYYIKYKILENGQDTLSQSQYYKKQFKNLRDAQMVKENALTVDDINRIMLIR